MNCATRPAKVTKPTEEQFTVVNQLIPRYRISDSASWQPELACPDDRCYVTSCDCTSSFHITYAVETRAMTTKVYKLACSKHRSDFDHCMEYVAGILETAQAKNARWMAPISLNLSDGDVQVVLLDAIRRKSALECSDWAIFKFFPLICEICNEISDHTFEPSSPAIVRQICSACMDQLNMAKYAARVAINKEVMGKMYVLYKAADINADVLGIIYKIVNDLITNDELTDRPESYCDLLL